MDQYAGSPVTVPTVMQNSLHHLSTSSITAQCLPEFMAQGKITEADALTIRPDYRRPLPSSPIFTWNALSAATLPIYPGLEQAPNNAGLHMRRLGYNQ